MGSEMCIRDRTTTNRQNGNARHQATRRMTGRSQLLHHQPDRSMAERPRCEQTQDARERQKTCTHERCCSPRYETRQLEPESRCTRSQTSSPIRHGEPCRRCDMSANQETQMQTRSLRRAPSMAYRPLITPKSERCSSQMQPAGTCKRRRYERTADRSSIREHPRYQARAQETSTRAATRRRNGRAQAQSRCQTRNEACMRRGSHHQASSRGYRRAQDQ